VDRLALCEAEIAATRKGLAVSPAVPQALRAWAGAGWLRELDIAFADFIAPLGTGEASDAPLVHLAAALLSHQVGRGQIRLDLAAALKDVTGALDLPPEGERPRTKSAEEVLAPPLPTELLAGVTLSAWLTALQAHPAVGEGAGSTPLVLQAGRLLLRRHWQCEQAIQQGILARLEKPSETQQPATSEGSRTRNHEDDFDHPSRQAALREVLDVLFPAASAAMPLVGGDGSDQEPDWQKIACALAARQAFAIITGGPGTGKTTTVVKLLAVLQHLALQATATPPRPLRIRLAAPTGKAAARLAESIVKARDGLTLDGLPGGSALQAVLPTEVSTLHRLLGVKPGSRHFRHNARQPLPLDVLVIDEASMVDLEMMAAVLAALHPAARLVLLGDKDQLASVEAGAVLGTLCQRADGGHYTPATRAWVQQVTGQDLGDAMTDPEGRPIDQAIVKLRKSHRFGEASGIGRLAQAVNAGQVEQARHLLTQGLPDLELITLDPRGQALPRLALASASGWRSTFAVMHQQRPHTSAPPSAFDTWAQQVLKAAGRFQLLCAVRGGPQGVEAVNRRIAQALAAEGLIPSAEGWYLGRPVMVTRNDYALGLMNGDVGVTLLASGTPVRDQPQSSTQRSAEENTALITGAVEASSAPPTLRVAFPDGRGGIRWVPPSRLQAIETVFAMTVHKSQGSEFDHVALVLPEHPSPLLTRELVYTAITRAMHRFTLTLNSLNQSEKVNILRALLP
jgi:exodeoxyribonuclease V alpha subunit